MQARETNAAGPLLARLRTYAEELQQRVPRGREKNSPAPSKLSVEERDDDFETVELPDDWTATDLEEAGIR